MIPGPEITFSAAAVCLSNTTSFNPVITTPPGTVVDSVVWDFGDGTTFNGLTSPLHEYTAAGNYQVTVTVYNDLLCTSTFIDTVVVHPLPVASFSNTLPCSGDTITFDGTLSQVSGNNITTWIWDFAGLATSTDSIPDYSFASPGNYQVTLIVNTAFGCSDTVQNQITVIQSPDFTFTFTEPCLGEGAAFTYLSNITPTPPSNLIWNFGDGTISSALSPTHLFSNFGNYLVSLTVTNPNTGCDATENSIINVKPLPSAGFITANNCQNLPLSFTDTSSIATGTITSWNWDFGHDADRQSEQAQPADHGDGAENLAERRDRNRIAVTDRRESCQCPPHRVRDRTKLFGLGLTFNYVHDGAGEDGGSHHQDHGTHQGATLFVERTSQRYHGRRITNEFQKAKQPEQPKDAQINARKYPSQIYWCNCKQVDDLGRAGCEHQSSEDGPPLPHRRNFNRCPDSRAIFDRENRD